MWDAHLKYLIKILISQSYISRATVKPKEYNLTICNFSPNGVNNEGLANPQLQSVIKPECDYSRLMLDFSTQRQWVRKYNIC